MLWGGRFKSQLDQSAFRFSSSFDVDKRLFHEDIFGSLAQADMLLGIGILTTGEHSQIISGLNQVKTEWDEGKWKPDSIQFEDIHSAVESRLKELIGDPAGKLHTGRSRNDQVATDVRLWIKKASGQLDTVISELQKILVSLAEKHIGTILPGYTHLQRAQACFVCVSFVGVY